MGAKTWMLVYSDGDASERLAARGPLDRPATVRMAARLFPTEQLEPLGDTDLVNACPPDNELVIGCYDGLTIVAAKEFGIDYPSRLLRHFIEAAPADTISLHAMHSVVDWHAFAVWHQGELQRALSVSPDLGIIENIGTPLPFEVPYWTGQRPAVDPGEDPASYPLPFHPLDLGEDSLLALFGFRLEGEIDLSRVQPEDVVLMRFRRRSPAWWKFW